MPRIIFVRPAETDLSQQDCLLGRFDADLNEDGYLAAKLLGEALVPYNPSYLVTSPLKRALSTAIAIEDKNLGLDARAIAFFEGMDLGDWSATSRTMLKASESARYRTWLTDPDFRAPGGESMREVYARAFPELVNLVHYADIDETLVFVVPDMVLKALSCGVLDLPLEHAQRFSMDRGAYSVFERIYEDGPYQLIAWNRLVNIPLCEEMPLFIEEEEPVLG